MASSVESKKRKANSPIVNREKESRCEPNMASLAENKSAQINLDQVSSSQSNAATTINPAFGLPPSQNSRRSSTTLKESYSTVTSKTTQQPEKRTRESVFTTSKPEGAFRDEIIVELQTLDDQVFRGSITLKEARKRIFQEILGFKQDALSGLIMAYSGGPIVTFKLHSQFNIDQLANVQFFELERKMMVRGEEKTSILKCKIRGIRTEQRVEGGVYEDTGMRWVKVEGCEYRVEKDQIVEWLSNFGEIKSEVTEDTHEESDDSENDMPVGNGIYSVRMKLSREMPQFMPMYGKRIRLYYRGIVKRCTNCFQPHQRKLCKNEKVMWPEYVRGFGEMFPEIPRNMYGKWKAMLENPTTTTSTNDEQLEHQEVEDAGTGTRSWQQPSETQSMQTKNQKSKLNEPGMSEEELENEDGGEGNEEKEFEQLVKRMLASGISAKKMQQTMEKESKREKAKLKSLALGKGRGRGSGRGKNK